MEEAKEEEEREQQQAERDRGCVVVLVCCAVAHQRNRLLVGLGSGGPVTQLVDHLRPHAVKLQRLERWAHGLHSVGERGTAENDKNSCQAQQQ
jgi:hypothetical protein